MAAIPQARADRAKELATHAIDKMGDPDALPERGGARTGAIARFHCGFVPFSAFTAFNCSVFTSILGRCDVGAPGFVASWRPIYQNRCAIKVGGSPFGTLSEAEEACTAMLGYLTRKLDGE
jgi:hypothetical protein